MIVVIVIVLNLIFAQSLFAWGFETHLNIGLNILESSTFHIINQFPAHFLLGNIFPDFFNLFKNLSTLKKSLNTHSWQTVSSLFSNATNDAEKSFAYGYAAHLSADIVAHNYFIPNYYIARSDKKLFAHFLTESAEESISDKKFKPSLYYLLEHSAELGSLFIKVNNIDEKYFKKQIKYIKFGLFYQYTLNIGKISQSMRKKNDPDFIKDCKKYQKEALKLAMESVEKGFTNFVKFDPSGHKNMKNASLARKKLVEDFGKENVNNFNFNKKKGDI